MSITENLITSDRLLREETNFIRGGLQLTVTAHNAIKKAFRRYAEQYIEAAAEIAKKDLASGPQQILNLKDFLL